MRTISCLDEGLRRRLNYPHILINQQNPNQMFGFGDYSGISRTDDAGQSWTNVTIGLPAPVGDQVIQSAAIDPLDPNTIWIGLKYGGLFVSHDSGDTWQESDLGILFYGGGIYGPQCTSIAIHLQDIAAVCNGRVYFRVQLVPLTAVTISGPSTGTTNVGQVFSATVSPITATTPIVYTWVPMPDNGQGTTAATYSWQTDGSKDITVTAENGGGVVTNTYTISLNTPVTGVVIDGPTTGVVNTTYAFTATVSPLTATMPITYTWSPEPNTGQGTTMVTFTWAITGTQIITVTVENVGSIVSDTHAVDIGELRFVYLPLVLR